LWSYHGYIKGFILVATKPLSYCREFSEKVVKCDVKNQMHDIYELFHMNVESNILKKIIKKYFDAGKSIAISIDHPDHAENYRGIGGVPMKNNGRNFVLFLVTSKKRKKRRPKHKFSLRRRKKQVT